MTTLRNPFNPFYPQNLARVGTPVPVFVSLSPEEILIIRNCAQLGAEILYPETSMSVMDWLDGIVAGEAWLQKQWRLFPSALVSHSGNAPAFIGSTSQDMGGSWRQNPAAQFDAMYFDVTLRKGLYAMQHTGLSASNGGRATVFFDNVNIGTIEAYSASAVNNVQTLFTNLSVPVTKTLQIQFVIDTRHASSTGWVFWHSYIDILRVADL